jgi:hypothetical protein
MGLSEATVPLIFFGICIFGIAQSSITIKTYMDTKKEKDSNFIFSALILTISLIGLLASMYMAYKAYKGGNGATAVSSNGAKAVSSNGATAVSSNGATAPSEIAGSQTNLGAQQMGLANKLEGVAANAELKAEKAKNAAKLANALGAKLGQLKQ